MVTTGLCPSLAPARVNAQGRVQKQSKHTKLPWQSPTVSSSEHGLFGSNTAAQQTKQKLFYQLLLYPGWLPASIMPKGHSSDCHIATGKALCLTLVCSLQETSQKRFKALCNYWILQCNYQCASRDPAKALLLEILVYWTYSNSSHVLAPLIAH